ncbi:unnamed protein product [Lupinus luteus]|uniref:Uncharacterized protein n=1 Tax=Lupinus luteus TaxID=3873 RepID=A0AAV1W7U8_LUPLU
MNIHQRQQELARRRLTRYERNNTNEAQPNQNNFDAHTNTGSIRNSFEEISTNISTPMRLTVVRQIARSSFQQQIQAAYNFGTTTYHASQTDEAGPSHVQTHETNIEMKVERAVSMGRCRCDRRHGWRNRSGGGRLRWMTLAIGGDELRGGGTVGMEEE